MDFMTFLGPVFTMEIPTNWFVASNVQYQAIFTHPQAQDGFQANLMLSIRPTQADVGIAEVAELARQTQAKEYPAYKILDEQVYEKDPMSVKRIYTWEHPEQKKEFQQIQFFVIHNQRLYTLTGTRLAQTPQGHLVDKVFNQMMDSFNLQV